MRCSPHKLATMVSVETSSKKPWRDGDRSPEVAVVIYDEEIRTRKMLMMRKLTYWKSCDEKYKVEIQIVKVYINSCSRFVVELAMNGTKVLWRSKEHDKK